MGRLKTVCITLYVVLCYFQAQGAVKYSDENRPYEFGFTIEGEQHRHEKKDKNGIIMGEFGFITADGVYHVTVYATDENGNFKIISMKNIRVKPYPGSPDTRVSAEKKGNSLSAERKGHSLPVEKKVNSLSVQPSQQLSTPHLPIETQKLKQEPSSPLRSCSHCKLPTTTTTTTPSPKISNTAVSSTSQNYNKQQQSVVNTQLAGSTQRNKQKYQQVNSEYESSLTREQPAQPSFAPNYQQGSISSQVQQNVPSPDQTYPNEPIDAIKQEQLSQNLASQQNYKDDFNVGRKYLQKQQPNAGTNSLVQSNAGLNYQQGFNSENQHPQGIIKDLQPPFINDQQILSPQSYSQQAGAKMQDFGAHKLKQNYPSANVDQNYVQGSNTKGNQHLQKVINQNQPKNPNQAINSPVQGIIPGDREPKTFSDILQTVNPEQHYNSIGTPPNSYASSQQNGEHKNIGKPVLVAAQMQVVDKNTNIYHKNPGENEGLPKGLTTGDMTELLYTFNYTVGFHGHHEEGYRSGAKIGYYYVTGRNGIRARVDYVADETGFHPRISQEVLDKQSDEVPKPETEKDAKYGLKGYEFKWLFYPIGT